MLLLQKSRSLRIHRSRTCNLRGQAWLHPDAVGADGLCGFCSAPLSLLLQVCTAPLTGILFLHHFCIISASFLHHSLSDCSLMAFIHGNQRARLQVYAPDDSVETAFHRTIYLFCCPKQSCFVEHQRQQSLHPSGGPKRSSFTPLTSGGCAFVFEGHVLER